MSDIRDMEPGDYVKTTTGYEKIKSIHGVDAKTGRLNKPSEGGFYVVTEGGQTVDMYTARSYHKRGEVEGK
jgi:hypothetical protein